MYKLKFIIPICLLFIQAKANAQNSVQTPLVLSELKTTSIVFPYAIKAVDRGSRDILAEKVREAENVLKVKASGPGFQGTNLTVITSDGKLYGFEVSYSANPVSTYLDMAGQGLAQVALEDKKAENELEEAAEMILKGSSSRLESDKADEVKANIDGIFVKRNQLYFRLTISNRAALSYIPESVSFTVEDTRQSKRTAAQAIELYPDYIYDPVHAVEGNSRKSMIYVLDQFTLADHKQLHIGIYEQNGGRTLNLRIGNKILLRAKTIN